MKEGRVGQLNTKPAPQRRLSRLCGYRDKALKTFEHVEAPRTNAFRVARNAAEFLPRAEAALGFPIDVISGHEEARLIYLGVAHLLPPSRAPRLVVDIGGGSTEFIIGVGLTPERLESLNLGCVGMSQRFFPELWAVRSRLYGAGRPSGDGGGR